MSEIYDKEGNPIGKVYDAEGNEIDETLTPDEVDQRIQDAKAEAEATAKEELTKLETALKEKEMALTQAQQELGKERDKDKNLTGQRTTIEAKEKKIEELETKIADLTATITQVKDNLQGQTLEQTFEKMSGGDTELKEKIKYHYGQFAIPAQDTPEKKAERLNNALALATAGRKMPSAVGQVAGFAGQVPRPAKNEGGEKLSEHGKGAAKALGISDRELKEHKLV